MRIVRDRRRAARGGRLRAPRGRAAFGDGTVFCERYVERAPPHRGPDIARRPRQRRDPRRARVLDPAPPPEDHRGDALAGGRPGACAQQLCAAAIAAARAVAYVGAGTVEFMLDPRRRVLLPGDEHPPAGRAPGHRVRGRARPGAAATPRRRGRPLPFDGAPPLRGHAIEVRLYAEDPAYGLAARAPAPCTAFEVPGISHEFKPLPTPGLRLDSGVADGWTIGVHYDPMLAKVIAWAPTRAEAARMLAAALARAQIHGVTTNRDLLVRVLRHPRSAPATSTPASSTGTPRSSPRCCPPIDAAGCPASPPRWPGRPPAGPPRRRSAGPAVRLAQRPRRAAGRRLRGAGRPDRGRATASTAAASSPPGRSGRSSATTSGGPASFDVADPATHPPVAVVDATPSGSVSTSAASASTSASTGWATRRSWTPRRARSRLVELPRFPLPPADVAEGSLHRAAARRGRPGAGRARPAGRRRRPAAHPGGDEARTPGARAGRGRGRRAPVPAGVQVETGPVLAVSHPSRYARRRDDLRLHRRAAPLRAAVARAGPTLRPRATSSRRRVRRTPHRAVGRGRPARLPRGQHPRAEYGGGGGGITELAIVCEELAAAGSPLLLLVVSPAIAATIIARHGTEEQRKGHLPGLADGSVKIVLRDHRAGGRLQLPPARHGRPPRRRRTG